MMQLNESLNKAFNRGAIAFIGASTFAMTHVQAFSEHSGYLNDVYKLEQISRPSGSNIIVRHNTRQSQISAIKKFLELNDQELADIIGVTRKTLYNWQKRGIDKEKDRQRVLELSVIAEDWSYNKLPTDKEKLLTPVLGSTSVMQMLTDKELDRGKIIFAGQRLAHQSLTPEVGLI